MRRLATVLAFTVLGALALSPASHAEPTDEFLCDPRMERPCIETPPIAATFQVGDERFVAHVVNPQTVSAIWQQYMGGVAIKRFPIATLHRGPGYNSAWSWRTDPLDITMVEVATEVCDGLPSQVESNLEHWLMLGTYCPWSAQVIDVKELPLDADADADGCADLHELGPHHVSGGQRDIFSFWDFFDVTGDRSIDLADTLDVLSYFGDSGTSTAADLRDRSVPDLSFPWRTAEADDGIDLIDAVASLRSFGDSCVLALP